jgi:hypothetical protein
MAPRTLEGYFSILDDTLIGFRVPEFSWRVMDG